ncbi:hypothetical protein [Rodentibacter pneumotropicus]|uniref:Uncharacterized protein n=1 Tax=Rodentibacter pneumotropicus TaxID=758 RepID=A0A448MNJ2_9PAST|nr:hypothetical protein [Rodentibacter pneumotropicus]NBH74883.1 hypothetical protein [Rodentibacter pneumotropicus]THA05314.1 hypothetical protein D3M73_07735 [Rodentibacter pneumotropicus]THA12838.1 hypothetical protein D3M81_03930 [Rodentibacter pneumotropicus]THA16131.1 hypothetical protein D3M82_03580 [Rodentibacter pneumotropicus]VEH66731.1 Uncharacterised protein [Rodentibacter pneumotropicus]
MEQIDLEMIRGDDEGFTFEVTEGDEQESAVNFDGCRLDLHIKPKRGDVIKLSTQTGEIAVENHLIHISISHDKTQGVKWESAKWDLQCIDQYHKVRTIAGGELTLIQDVTVVNDE